jgi:hypothetical protein
MAIPQLTGETRGGASANSALAMKENHMVFIKASALKESEAIIIPSLRRFSLVPILIFSSPY